MNNNEKINGFLDCANAILTEEEQKQINDYVNECHKYMCTDEDLKKIDVEAIKSVKIGTEADKPVSLDDFLNKLRTEKNYSEEDIAQVLEYIASAKRFDAKVNAYAKKNSDRIKECIENVVKFDGSGIDYYDERTTDTYINRGYNYNDIIFNDGLINEFWTREFHSGEFVMTRKDWTPDKYGVAAKRDDRTMLKAAETIAQLLNGEHNEVTDYMLNHKWYGSWYKNMYATAAEREEIETKYNGNTVAYFFGSKKYEEVRKHILSIFGDCLFHELFENTESPLYKFSERMEMEKEKEMIKKISAKLSENVKNCPEDVFKGVNAREREASVKEIANQIIDKKKK